MLAALMSGQDCDHLIDNRIGLRLDFSIGRVLNRMGHEDAWSFGQAQSFGLDFGGIDEHVSGDHCGRLAVDFEPD
jgi:hypothetical protein